MHCHIARHAAEGLGLQILERRLDAVTIWPNLTSSPALREANRVCVNWRTWQGNSNNWFNRSDPLFQNDSGV